MKNRRRMAYLPLVASVVVGIATLIYLTGYGESGRLSLTNPMEKPQQNTGSFLLAPSGIRYDNEGGVTLRWQAAAAERRAAQAPVEFSAIELSGSGNEGPDWHGSAGKGTLSADRGQLQLRDSVVIEELMEAATVRSDILNVNIAGKTLFTDEAVTIKKPGTTITARGMTAHTDTREITLNNDVQSYYENQK